MMKTKDGRKWVVSSEPWDSGKRVTSPRVFWRKSVDLLDSKGVDFFGSDKEFVRV